jgi:hypothetical protein
MTKKMSFKPKPSHIWRHMAIKEFQLRTRKEKGFYDKTQDIENSMLLNQSDRCMSDIR